MRFYGQSADLNYSDVLATEDDHFYVLDRAKSRIVKVLNEVETGEEIALPVPEVLNIHRLDQGGRRGWESERIFQRSERDDLRSDD